MHRWDIYRAYINFEDDQSQGKKRPILIINVSSNQFIACKITSKYRDNELEYEIKDWVNAGLDEQSYIRLLHKIYLPFETQMIYLGTLQKIDIDNIKALCQKYDIKLNESFDETSLQGQILKRGDLARYKISDEELDEVRSRKMVNENKKLNPNAVATQEVNDLLAKGEDFADEFNLPMDRRALKARDEYIRTIYNFATNFSGHDVENHTIDIEEFEDRIGSNIQGWFDHTYSIEIVAPRKWRAAWYDYFLDWLRVNYY